MNSAVAETKGRQARSLLLYVLKTGLAAGIIVWIISSNRKDLFDALGKIKLEYLACAVALYAVHLGFGAFRWLMLLRIQSVRVSYFETLSLVMQGFFFSLVIPAGAVGGDIVKGGFLAARAPEGRKVKGVVTIFIDRIIGLVGLFIVAGTLGLMLREYLAGLSGFLEMAVYMLIGGCFAGLLSIIGLFFHRTIEKFPIVRTIIGKLDSLSNGAVSSIMEAVDGFRGAWKTLLGCLLITVVFIHLNLGLILFFLGKGLQAESTDPRLFLLTSSIGNAVAGIPLTPSGIGTRDIVVRELLMAGSVGNAAATAVPLVFTALVLFFNSTGGLFFVLDRNRKKSELPVPSENAGVVE